MIGCRNTCRLLALVGVGVFGLLTLVGSGGGGGGGDGGGPPAAGATVFPRFAYVVNNEDALGGVSGTVSIYRVDAATGQLHHRGYVAAGSGPRSVTVDPSGRFAYVASASNRQVFLQAVMALPSCESV